MAYRPQSVNASWKLFLSYEIEVDLILASVIYMFLLD